MQRIACAGWLALLAAGALTLDGCEAVEEPPAEAAQDGTPATLES